MLKFVKKHLLVVRKYDCKVFNISYFGVPTSAMYFFYYLKLLKTIFISTLVCQIIIYSLLSKMPLIIVLNSRVSRRYYIYFMTGNIVFILLNVDRISTLDSAFKKYIFSGCGLYKTINVAYKI